MNRFLRVGAKTLGTKASAGAFRVFAAVLVPLLGSSFGWSQSTETLNLQTVLDETMRGSPGLKKAEASLHEAIWKKREALSGFLPTVSAGLNYLLDKKYMLVNTQIGAGTTIIQQIIPTTNYTLQASLPIFDGFANVNRYRAGSKLEDASLNELEWTHFVLERSATLSFYRAIAARSLKDVSEQNFKTLKDHLKDAQAMKKAGVSTSYDVLRVEVQVSEAESETMNADDNLEVARLRLGEIMGLEKETRTLVGELPALKADLAAKIEVASLKSRRDLIALRQRSEMAHAQDSAASRYWIPKAAIYGQYNHYNNINDRFSDETAFRDAYQVGVNLTWNLFDGMSSTARSEQAQAQAVQVDMTLRQSELKAAQDLEQWRRKFIYFCRVYNSRAEDVQRSTEAIRLAREGRRAGTRTSTDLLDAELDLFRSRAGRVNAQIGAIEALVNLEMASGQKLYDFH